MFLFLFFIITESFDGFICLFLTEPMLRDTAFVSIEMNSCELLDTTFLIGILLQKVLYC